MEGIRWLSTCTNVNWTVYIYIYTRAKHRDVDLLELLGDSQCSWQLGNFPRRGPSEAWPSSLWPGPVTAGRWCSEDVWEPWRKLDHGPTMSVNIFGEESEIGVE